MNKDLILWELVRSSTAAPTYFDPQRSGTSARARKRSSWTAAFACTTTRPWQLLLAATLKGFGFRWPLGEERMLLCSAGTGSFFKLPRKDRLRRLQQPAMGRPPDQPAHGRRGELNETILQWLSSSPTPQVIDRQMGACRATCRAPGPSDLPALRHPPRKQSLSAVGLEYRRTRRKLWEMSDVQQPRRPRESRHVRRAAAVSEDHFPAVFDRRSGSPSSS